MSTVPVAGDLVEVRQWDDLAREFGVEDGAIKMMYAFTESMRRFSGNCYEVASNNFGVIRLKAAGTTTDADPLDVSKFAFSFEMLGPAAAKNVHDLCDWIRSNRT